MSRGLPGMGSAPFEQPEGERLEFVTSMPEFRRTLAFAGRSIDQVVNDPIARLDVAHWFRIGRWMQRRIEIHNLEKQWNPLR